MKLEEFNVVIELVEGVFIALIKFTHGEGRVAYGSSMQQLYQRIYEVLSIRLDDDAVEVEGEQ